VPGTPFGVQWLPTAFAALAVAIWCVKHRTRLTPSDAITHLPWLVGLSLLVAPYGAWAYDLVLMLGPVLVVAARLARAPDRRAIAAGGAWLASVNAVSLVMMLNGVSSEWYVWFAPCTLLGAGLTAQLSCPSERRGRCSGRQRILLESRGGVLYSDGKSPGP
jgi:hypothetical protein